MVPDLHRVAWVQGQMEGEMKRIIMLGIIVVTMPVSLWGCFGVDQGRDRGEDMWTMIENKDCASRKLVKI